MTCANILFSKLPGKDAIAKAARNIPALAFHSKKINETLQIIIASILKKLEAIALLSFK